MFSLESSNPAFNDKVSAAFGREQTDTATLQGVVNKTSLLVGIAVLAGAGGYWLVNQYPGAMWIIGIAGFIVTLGILMFVCSNPMRAKTLAPIYAIVEGCFLGAVTGMLDSVLKSSMGTAGSGLALQAFAITVSITGAMLLLYKLRILRPTERFVATIKVLTLGIFLTYLVSFILSMITGQGLPFLRIGSVFEGGMAPMIGLGINVLFLGIASLWLIIDFGTIENIVDSGQHKDMEWYGGFALLVTLAWIYYESVKLAFRLSIMFGGRD